MTVIMAISVCGFCMSEENVMKSEILDIFL